MIYTPDRLKWHRDYYHKKKNDPKYRERRRLHRIKYEYGLSQEDIEEMLDEQDHKCKICKRDKNQFSRGLYIDHDHLTGRIRGLLCVTCNNFLGAIEDDPDKSDDIRSYLSDI